MSHMYVHIRCGTAFFRTFMDYCAIIRSSPKIVVCALPLIGARTYHMYSYLINLHQYHIFCNTVLVFFSRRFQVRRSRGQTCTARRVSWIRSDAPNSPNCSFGVAPTSMLSIIIRTLRSTTPSARKG